MNAPALPPLLGHGLPPEIAAALDAWKVGRHIQRPIVVVLGAGVHVIPEAPLTGSEREMIDSKDEKAITIVKILGCSEKTVRNRRDRAFRKLREALNEEDA